MSRLQILPRFAIVLCTAAVLLLFGSHTSFAQKVVLLPMADVSQGENGVNLGFTKVVETALKQLGIELVSRNEVMLFMAKNKVRTYRYLDSYLVKKIGTNFDCSLVLIGTISEWNEKDPAIGLTFTALDTLDGNPVWSTSAATSAQEQIRMLGVGEPKSLIELARPMLKETLEPIAELAHKAQSSERRDYQLLGMQLFPGYVQGGQVVEANLKIRFLGQRPTLIAAESAAGKSYLQYDRRTDSYAGEWYAPRDEGTYRVDLRIEWGRERTVEKVAAVANYEVINQPPGLQVEMKNTIKVGQRLAFKDHLLILPRIDNLRPMAGWSLEIKRESGETAVYEEYEGDMPERMVWEGRGADGFPLKNGVYEIILQVWDLAGNRSSDSQWVALQTAAPKVSAEITRSPTKSNLTLSTVGHYEFPIVDWQAELRSQTGQLLVKDGGRQLPAVLDFTPPADETHAFLTVTGEDLLGNRLKVTRQKVPFMKVEDEIKQQETKSWVPDF